MEKPYFRDRCVAGPLPACAEVAARVISLPLFDSMTHDEVEYVAQNVHEVLGVSETTSDDRCPPSSGPAPLVDPGPTSWRLLLGPHKMTEGWRFPLRRNARAIRLRRWANPSTSSPSRTDAEQRPAREHIARPVEERTRSMGIRRDNILGRCKFEVICHRTQRCYQSPTSGSGIPTAPENSMPAVH
jgi:hypothetical protein